MTDRDSDPAITTKPSPFPAGAEFILGLLGYVAVAALLSQLVVKAHEFMPLHWGHEYSLMGLGIAQWPISLLIYRNFSKRNRKWLGIGCIVAATLVLTSVIMFALALLWIQVIIP